ncbi:MAG: GNAT family N-acetyltransferase [Spirochaetaceae bacterium]
MEVREILHEDLESIYNLSKQLGYTYSKNKMDKRIVELIKSTNDKIFVAFDPRTNSVTGYIHLQVYKTLYFDSLLNILGIVVDKDIRNKGIGSLLINKAEEYAKNESCVGIRANSGSSRISAHSFYRKSGFMDESDQKKFIKIFSET